MADRHDILVYKRETKKAYLIDMTIPQNNNVQKWTQGRRH